MTSVPVDTSVADGIGRVTLHHPPLNILTRAVLGGLRDALASLAATQDLRVLVLTAEGKHFSAGADVGEHLPPDFREMIPEFLDTVAAIEAFPAPVIAAVKGRCLGGGFELIQAADIVVAGEGSSFGQPEILLGVFPPAACVILPERCGHGNAAEILFTGDPVAAAVAHRIGLVQRVVPDDRLEQEATALAERIARHSAAALRLTKRALRRTRGSEFETVGSLYIDDLMSTEDALEGLRAFPEKRTPVWSHQ
ncbi:MAG: enoyl-CoA hydratase/isomerase family protein [Gemmatimonadales bacterium]|nr:enoyl-CoA hydratase/isomerase family protein [Gemmatimonadales bacterium]